MSELNDIIAQLEHQRTAIETAIAALRGISGQAEPAKRRGRPRKNAKKRAISAEGRQRQIEAMRKYWAAKKAAGPSPKKRVAKKAAAESGE